MPTPLLILIYLLAPALILWVCKRYRWVEKIGSVLWAYILGLLLSNLNLLPDDIEGTQYILSTIAVPLAIPLLLFSSNIRDWKTLARSTSISLAAGVVAVIITVIAGYFIFDRVGIDDLEKVSGMLIGVYTGGTPNLAALQMALGVDADTYLTIHTYDMLVSFVFLLFMISIGQRALGFILPKSRIIHTSNHSGFFKHDKRMSSKDRIVSIGTMLLLSIIIFGVGVGISLIFGESQQTLVVILTITTLGITTSFFPKVNSAPYTYETGMYLILVFSIVVASMVDIKAFITSPPVIFDYIAFTVVVSVLLHVLLSRLLKVDTDTTIIVSTSLICSPAFVPFVATAIQNKKVILGGITAGLIGFALGNYLGVIIYKLLLAF